jgi:potassium/hydrogen antiporter
MTITIILTFCALLLLAYLFDVSAPRTRIPSVILLLILGWTVRQGADFLGIFIPDLSEALPILGTIGLILIVLEGSLELEINKKKLPLVGKTSLMALLPLLTMSFALAIAFHYYTEIDLKICLANAIPFAVISSAIAIPTAQNLGKVNREFITYESSLSDIFGVIFFNFIALNDSIGAGTFGFFLLDIVLMLIISFVASLALSFMLGRSNHPVKFLPIIVMVVMIYTISKIYHLPSLIFIMLFGLFLGNLDELNHIKYIHWLRPERLNKEVHKFREIITEITFLVRALFFLLFGFLIEAAALLNIQTFFWAAGITFSIFFLRYLYLKVFQLKTSPILFIAPRGLISILLFISLPVSARIDLVGKPLIIQVILLTALVLMYGTITYRKVKGLPPLPPDVLETPQAELSENGLAEVEQPVNRVED